jgi:hypothetical protein
MRSLKYRPLQRKDLCFLEKNFRMAVADFDATSGDNLVRISMTPHPRPGQLLDLTTAIH